MHSTTLQLLAAFCAPRGYIVTCNRRLCALHLTSAISLLLFSACQNRQEAVMQSRLIPIREIQGYIVPQDSIKAPVSIQIDERKLKMVAAKNAVRVPLKTNAIPAQLTESVPLDTLRICIPGRDSFSFPKKKAIVVTPVPAPAPEVVSAKAMQVKDSNSGGFGFFRSLEGLQYDNVRDMMIDQHGHLCLATVGGFTRYDGKYFSHFSFTEDITDWSGNIHEDADGNTWFGNQKGLIKYDGKTFAVFDESIGFPTEHLYFVEKSGIIWIAPNSGGIAHLTPASITPDGSLHYSLMHFGEKEGFTDDIIDRIIQDQAGNRWFLCREMRELIKLDPQNGHADSIFSFVHFKMPAAFYKNLPGILEDHNGQLWFGGDAGIWKYDGDSLHHFASPQFGIESVVPILMDRNGDIWCTIYRNGIIRFTPEQHGGMGTFTHLTTKDGLSSEHVNAILEDTTGNLWLGTDDGLNLFHRRTMTHLTEKEGIQGAETRSILQDRSGNIWFGHGEEGISRYDGESFVYYNKLHGLSHNGVFSSLEDRNANIWFGTIGGGVTRYTPPGVNHEGSFTHFTKENGLAGSVYSSHEDHEGNIWFGEFAGYIGSSSKLYRYTPPRGNHLGTLTSFTNAHGLSDTSIIRITEDNEHNLWFATWQGGITKYTPPTADLPAVFTHYTVKEGLKSNDVRSIVKDVNGNLWFCTSMYGLIYFNGTSIVNITIKEGLSSNYTKSGFSDHLGNLWFGTEYGLNMLSRPIIDTIARKVLSGTLTENDIRFRTYTYENGFAGTSCWSNSITEDRHGNIWVGAKDRVTCVQPELTSRDTVAPNLQLIGIDLFNESIDWSEMDRHPDSSVVLGNGVPLTRVRFESIAKWYPIPEKLSLAHKNNFLTFRFIGITLSLPGEMRYQYKLDGMDFDWSNLTSDNFATYGNLPPGKYTFQVRARNHERYWSRTISYPFTIRHPWWRTWWAYTLYVIFIATALWRIFMFTKNRLRLQLQLRQEQDEAIRLKELDTFKSRLFTNLTHEFRTPLTVILGMTSQLASGNWRSALTGEVKEKVSLGLKLIENNGKNLLHLINQLLDLSKLENKSFRLHSIQSDIIPYLRYVTESFQSFAEDHNLSIRFISQSESLVMDFDPQQIKQILTNLISNALKFTPAGGEIIVELISKAENLEVLVTDTGIGISEKDLPHVLERFYQADSSNTRVAQGTGIGLAHTQELLKVMGGTIAIESELGKGTRVKILLPIKHKEAVVAKDEITLTAIPHMSILGLNKKSLEELQTDIIRDESIQSSRPRVLIIEDSPDVVLYLRSCLEHAYETDIARNGLDGIEKAIQSIPDLIISDVMMPAKDGFEVCDTLKNDERTSHVPLILLTAKADAVSRLTGLRRGADAYLAKPFDLEELLVNITLLLENRRRMATYFSKLFQQGIIAPTQDVQLSEDLRVENAFVKKLHDILEAHYTEEEYALPNLCRDIGMSRSQLFRKLKAVADIAPSDLIRTFRLQKAKSLLEQGQMTVAEVTYHVGFKDPSYFSKMYQEEFGVQPSVVGK